MFIYHPQKFWYFYRGASIGVSHCGLAIYIDQYLKAKEELWKSKYFTAPKYNLQKNPLKEPESFKIS
jgi:hypothetical protein